MSNQPAEHDASASVAQSSPDARDEKSAPAAQDEPGEKSAATKTAPPPAGEPEAEGAATENPPDETASQSRPPTLPEPAWATARRPANGREWAAPYDFAKAGQSPFKPGSGDLRADFATRLAEATCPDAGLSEGLAYLRCVAEAIHDRFEPVESAGRPFSWGPPPVMTLAVASDAVSPRQPAKGNDADWLAAAHCLGLPEGKPTRRAAKSKTPTDAVIIRPGQGAPLAVGKRNRLLFGQDGLLWLLDQQLQARLAKTGDLLILVGRCDEALAWQQLGFAAAPVGSVEVEVTFTRVCTFAADLVTTLQSQRQAPAASRPDNSPIRHVRIVTPHFRLVPSHMPENKGAEVGEALHNALCFAAGGCVATCQQWSPSEETRAELHACRFDKDFDKFQRVVCRTLNQDVSLHRAEPATRLEVARSRLREAMSDGTGVAQVEAAAGFLATWNVGQHPAATIGGNAIDVQTAERLRRARRAAGCVALWEEIEDVAAGRYDLPESVRSAAARELARARDRLRRLKIQFTLRRRHSLG